MQGIEIYSRHIGAAEAHALLSHNVVNRNMSEPNIMKMARDMVEGRWTPNPQPIMLGPDGRLIDGQHRLTAVTRADAMAPGIRVLFMVATNVPESAFDVVDQGQPRSAAQTLGIHGFQRTVKIAAAARIVLRYERYPDRIWSGAVDASKAEVIAFSLKHQDQVTLLDKPNFAERLGLNGPAWMALQWLTIRQSGAAEMWPGFASGVLTGAGLEVGDPRLALRNRGRVASDAWGGGQARLGLYAKSWNAFVDGRSIRLLRYRREELPMPVIH